MTTLSLRDTATGCLGLTGDISVNSDVYGYRYRDEDGLMFGALGPDDILPANGTPTTRSLRRHLETVRGRAVDVVIFLVGHEPDFSGAVSRADVAKVQYGIQVARDIYAQVDLGIRRIIWGRIGMLAAGPYLDVHSGVGSWALTRDFSGRPGALDVFVVQELIGPRLGESPVNGPCHKDSLILTTGVLVELIGSGARDVGHALAHEAGHYLGLHHDTSDTNLMYDSNVYDAIHLAPEQADIMKEHCFMNTGCG